MTYVCVKVLEQRSTDILDLRALGGTNAGYVAFLVMSYLVGHGVDLVGSLLWDELYDLTYAHWKRSVAISPVRWVIMTPKRLAKELRNRWRYFSGESYEKASRTMDTLFQRAELLAAASMTKDDRVFQWCRTSIALKSAPAFSEIERLQANSKFFRGMVTVSAITALLSLTVHTPFYLRGAFVCLFLTGASFLRFSDLRWKAVQQTYRFFIALSTPQMTGAGGPSKDIDDAEEA